MNDGNYRTPPRLRSFFSNKGKSIFHFSSKTSSRWIHVRTKTILCVPYSIAKMCPIPDSKGCGKVAILLSIGCPRKHFRANRFGNHSRKIKLFINYLSYRVQRRPEQWLLRLPSNPMNARFIPGLEEFEVLSLSTI
ncbi:hypothetical protein AVEN_135993-1 [Araneus ventricosus]|uniref:Uncharacterized protein n=1 Tax=Araneus ventricosus TaxID=182803 RepID=A0A4Y2LGN4_ARAVE|nr:hypothetical protein AVEN_135993-1 [Araneus ventricosus]